MKPDHATFDYPEPDFDEVVERRGTGCSKWDAMEAKYGVSAEDGLPMWVADMDFRAPEAVIRTVHDMADHGVFGYHGDDTAYRDAIRWWMAERHGWAVEREEILSTNGLVNAAALCVDLCTAPGDAVVMFSPVYHAFYRVLQAAGRDVVECEMPIVDGRYTLDFEACDTLMTGREKLLLFCSPHNPGGRVWTRAELEGVAEFARRHDLILVSDEIHADLLMPGQTHIPMARIGGIEDRLIMLTAATKTFNIAGAHIGNAIIPDPDLRRRFARRMAALGTSASQLGIRIVEAAYSPEGAAWVDALMRYLDGNRRIFDTAIGSLPGIHSMPLEATYLAWVDFRGTGMTEAELHGRVYERARIAPNQGPTFGTGGTGFLRFNLATRRALVEQAVQRLTSAFADLQ